jgi:hypothetical protein
MAESFYLNVLPPRQKKTLKKLIADDLRAGFYLAGGTALALQLGHRRSIDFDLFSPDPFDAAKKVRDLDQSGKFELFHQDKDTVNGSLDGVRLSFFHYPYRLIQPFLAYETLPIARKLDIAAMKVQAIAGRGSRKDFIDLYFLLREHPLDKIMAAHSSKFGSRLANRYHVCKSLVYFADAEEEAMPRMLIPTSWPQVKKTIAAEVKKYAIL